MRQNNSLYTVWIADDQIGKSVKDQLREIYTDDCLIIKGFDTAFSVQEEINRAKKHNDISILPDIAVFDVNFNENLEPGDVKGNNKEGIRIAGNLQKLATELGVYDNMKLKVYTADPNIEEYIENFIKDCGEALKFEVNIKQNSTRLNSIILDVEDMLWKISTERILSKGLIISPNIYMSLSLFCTPIIQRYKDMSLIEVINKAKQYALELAKQLSQATLPLGMNFPILIFSNPRSIEQIKNVIFNTQLGYAVRQNYYDINRSLGEAFDKLVTTLRELHKIEKSLGPTDEEEEKWDSIQITRLYPIRDVAGDFPNVARWLNKDINFIDELYIDLLKAIDIISEYDNHLLLAKSLKTINGEQLTPLAKACHNVVCEDDIEKWVNESHLNINEINGRTIIQRIEDAGNTIKSVYEDHCRKKCKDYHLLPNRTIPFGLDRCSICKLNIAGPYTAFGKDYEKGQGSIHKPPVREMFEDTFRNNVNKIISVDDQEILKEVGKLEIEGKLDTVVLTDWSYFFVNTDGVFNKLCQNGQSKIDTCEVTKIIINVTYNSNLDTVDFYLYFKRSRPIDHTNEFPGETGQLLKQLCGWGVSYYRYSNDRNEIVKKSIWPTSNKSDRIPNNNNEYFLEVVWTFTNYAKKRII